MINTCLSDPLRNMKKRSKNFICQEYLGYWQYPYQARTEYLVELTGLMTAIDIGGQPVHDNTWGKCM